MGNAARLVLIGATSLVVGIYTVALKNIETGDVSTAVSQYQRVQTERIEDAAMRVATYRVQYNVDQYRDVMYSSSALNISATRTALGGGSYSYNLYVPYGQYYATGTVTVTPPNEATKTIDVRIEKMIGTGSTRSTGTKPGYRRLIRGRYQTTEYFVRSIR